MSASSIYNYIKISDQFISGGQPTVEQVQAVAAEGFTAVINLATLNPEYALADEAGLVRSLGMAYFHIPVAWENPTEADFALFEQCMQQLLPGRTLIHCAANYRVTAFYSLYAMKYLGWNEIQAGAFRKPVWQGSDYPTWEAFIAKMQSAILASL
jgi:protein tyrosine phosphatase (PTP) superfamily phosphohydrolase (DUF442 family)